MIIFSREDGTWPLPKDIGCKDYYHNQNGEYFGQPIFVPYEWRDNPDEFVRKEARS